MIKQKAEEKEEEEVEEEGSCKSNGYNKRRERERHLPPPYGHSNISARLLTPPKEGVTAAPAAKSTQSDTDTVGGGDNIYPDLSALALSPHHRTS